MNSEDKIGFGGGCHWCTEAVFQSLKGVISVEQGYIASTNEFASFSEGVLVTYNPKEVSLELLIEIHVLTHKSSKNHSMRDKYRSAIYTFSEVVKAKAKYILSDLNKQHKDELITLVLDFNTFKTSREEITNYYFKNPEKPFCKTFINPKLKLLLTNYTNKVNCDKLDHLKLETTL
ncbi:peptide-methionine (S)-S-oxide reductase [uncultured Psychroserpens sp.]|uniref:peptide-methionine (S)-S-oxide reductase n=1 Tax=uncultured Psychroserpens sp. TaxID=255436 RepID=UPI002614BD22|nr:peptide-methionine (S)-S-oxide reductase [uncultured Psychroserpens sp.]